MTYHPDHNPAGAEKMKLSNAAYETLKECAGDVKAAANEQCPARAVANDINRRLLPNFLQAWQKAETRRQAQEVELEFYRHQVDLLRRFVPEFEQRYSRLPSGTNKFYFRDGSVQFYSSEGE
jgi:hypothetical protein